MFKGSSPDGRRESTPKPQVLRSVDKDAVRYSVIVYDENGTLYTLRFIRRINQENPLQVQELLPDGIKGKIKEDEAAVWETARRAVEEFESNVPKPFP